VPAIALWGSAAMTARFVRPLHLRQGLVARPHQDPGLDLAREVVGQLADGVSKVCGL